MSSGSHAGRPKSWVAVTIIFIGFAVGGWALVIGPHWPLFWGGAAITLLGGVVAWAVDIMTDVVVDEPHS
ncbi:HGxxPAAW family protein [Spirillospora sp. NPDC047279]|uniref:HGxxPAAW family protein n=1 Tax=Spirillospora sp. NPDC047279 TaxID=3155478 RepID=UPI003408C34D